MSETRPSTEAAPGWRFADWDQDVISTWSDFQEAAYRLSENYRGSRLVWRGVRNADWGVHSSLYRRLSDVLGYRPTETEMVDAEKEILRRARQDWRFDGVDALELFAQIQHFGGPTRLIDVSEDPLAALWFAVEAGKGTEPTDTDGRLFAFVAPVKSDLHLNRNWKTRDALWHELTTDDRRATKRWGTGTNRRYWRPPVYHSRIAAQNAGFLLDGVPLDAGARNKFGRVHPGTSETWTLNDMQQAASIPLRLSTSRQGTMSEDANPVFTFRVLETAKEEIRRQLEERFAVRASSIYPDMFGLAKYLDERAETLLA
ncbi:FRG domain-containing protein [Demequina sediminicola]|uniref:FRG domain-containing protein n=1 Tax=Demequina sediminicola TaxID=1095026 RepID=UPI000782C81E|nr:FRG domain-containing protein [Demequina sediminicola]